MRAGWIYDTRKMAENKSYGWSFFANSGAFTGFQGRMFISTAPNEAGDQSGEFLNEQFRYALTQNARPTP